MSEPLKLAQQRRDLCVDATAITQRNGDGGRVRLTFPASSDAPVARFWGVERLVHAEGAIRLGRVASGAAPLLFNHAWDDPIGMVEAGRVVDGRLEVDAALFDTARAAEVRAMIDGGLRNVSIGYEIHAVRERQGARDEFDVIDWEPLEVSLVTVPADASVGIGRANGNDVKPVRVIRANDPATAATKEEHASMAKEKADAAADNADAIERDSAPTAQVTVTARGFDAGKYEEERKVAIRNLCRAQKIDERIEQEWITTGATFGEVSEGILQILKKRSESAPRSEAFLDMSQTEVRRYSLLRALNAAKRNDWRKAGLEFEAHNAIAERTGRQPEMSNGFFVPFDIQTRNVDVAGTSGSDYLVSTDNKPGSFVDLLRNRSVTMAMGITRLSGLVGNVTIPKQTAAATAYWLADETTDITESQPTFGQLSLSAKNVAALTEISEQMMRQSSPDAEGLIMRDLAAVIALAVDVAVLRGSGAAGQPQGIVGTAGIGAVTGTDLGYAGVIECQTDVAGSNALVPGCGYVTTPAVAGLLAQRARFSNTDTPLWDGSILDARMAGHRAMSSNQMAAATMLFGDWSQVILGEWGVLELATHATDFAKGLTGVRAWYTCDVGLRVPGAFTLVSAIT